MASTWKPTYPWLRTSRHWTKPLRINAYVVEHRDGIMLFDTARTGRRSPTPGYFPGAATGILYDRLARFDIGPGNTLTARLEAIGYDLADVRTAVLSHLHQDHIDGLPELRDAAADVVSRQERSGSSYNNRWEPRGLLRSHIELPGLHWRRIELAPTDDPGLVPFTAGHPLFWFGDGSLVLPPTPGHTSGSLSMLVRRPG